MKYTVSIYLTKTIDSVAELSHIGSHVIPAVFAPEGFMVENMQVSRQYDAPTMPGSGDQQAHWGAHSAPAAEPVKRTRTKKAEAASAEVSLPVVQPGSDPELQADVEQPAEEAHAVDTTSAETPPESAEEATATIEEVRAYANLRIKGDAAQGIEADNGFGAKVAEVLKNQFGVKALSDVADKTKPSPKFAQVLAALKEVK